jgi:hypothetical protein
VRSGGLIALWAALALAAASCSGGDDEQQAGATTTAQSSTGAAEDPPATTQPPAGESDAGLVADAARQTVSAGSARVATIVRVIHPGTGQDRLSGSGAFDFEESVGRMAIKLVEGDDSAGTETTAIFAGPLAYVQVPEGTLPAGKRWVRIDPRNLADVSAAGLGPLVQAGQADPSVYLAWLNALGPGVTKIGEEEVRGAPTSRYRAAVDLGLLESQAPPGREAEWSAYVQTLRDRLGTPIVPVEVWVDDDGLIRRLYHEYGFAADGTTSTVTTELFDFGVAVEAEAPPPGQVADIGDLISR